MSRLSIIVPVYNVEKYLHQCLESILKQTFVDWECLLVNDCSTDNSESICKEYVLQDKRYSYWTNERNMGVSATRNKGIEHSNSEWITFIDADDFIESTFLENLYKPIEMGMSIDFVQAGATYYRNNQPCKIVQHYDYRYDNDPAYLFEHFRGLTFSKLFRVSILNNQKHLRFDENIRSSEDMAFTLDYIILWSVLLIHKFECKPFR